jgi:carboxylesterase type B
MSRFSLLLIGSLIALISLIAVAQERPTVDLGYVHLRGSSNRSFDFFGGIPYAQAPTEDLRFRKPVPIEASAGPNSTILDASRFGAACIQPGNTMPGSEDCLFVDVYTPPNSQSQASKLPVVAWIHVRTPLI